MIPSVPGHPLLRLLAQLLNTAAIMVNKAKTKNNLFII
jgi:hypothetical protein